jgi:hypothetical protein
MVNGQSYAVTQAATPPLLFVPVTPCRIADTRYSAAPFTGPFGSSGRITQPNTSKQFPIIKSSCSIPPTAVAYSLNVTVVPNGALNYLTIWPTGESQPVVSTLNSMDGRIKANAVIIGAGSDGNGSVSVFGTQPTDIILDINGYFVPESSNPSALAFYPLPPCRVVNTGLSPSGNGLDGPNMVGNATRDFPILSSSCFSSVPQGTQIQAYSLNFTAVTNNQLGFLSVWPTGQTQPNVSTLNALYGGNSSAQRVVANAAIVPAGSSGAITVYSMNDTQLIIDVNGYFATQRNGGLAFYPATPCRALGAPQVYQTVTVDVIGSSCAPPSTAEAYVLNATVVPQTMLGYLTMWPDNANQPIASTLNSLDGSITSNMAIVPTTDGKINAYVKDPTTLILDYSGFFAP